MNERALIGPLTRSLLIAAGADAPGALDRALDLGVDATLYRLRPHPSHAHVWRGHLADTLARRRLLSELRERLDRIGVEAVVLKGEPLARRLFQDPFARRSGDIDLLVALEDARPAGDELRAGGFSPMYRARPEPWISDEWSFVHGTTRQVVELHWAIASPYLPSPPARDLIERSVVPPWSDGVPVLSPEDCGLNLMLHFHHHAGFFKGLVDVAAWLDTHEEHEVVGTLDRARALGLLGVASWPLRALERLTPYAPPLEISSSPIPRLFGELTARASRGVLARDEPLEGAHPLSFKTRGMSRAQTTAWHCACASLLDEPSAAIRAIVWPITRDPASLALAAGRDRPDLIDWAHFALRPALLAGRALSDLTREGDHP